MREIPFVKMEGVGNHFVLVDEATTGPLCWEQLAIDMGAKGTGVGSDGLLVAAKPADDRNTCRMIMHNPDGSEDMCGNGLRCVAHYAASELGVGADNPMVIETISGPRRARVWDVRDGAATVQTSLGSPILEPSAMPALFDESHVLGERAAFGDYRTRICLVSTGTPHCVIFGPPPTDKLFREVSPTVQTDPRFPEGINVMWASVVGENRAEVRPWERGANATMACGTGASAAAVAGILTGRLQSPVTVSMPGGELLIEWLGLGCEVHQTGPTRNVYSANWFVYD